MKSLNSDPFPETNPKLPPATLKRVPRLASLNHRLLHAKDADGRPIPLRDELLFFLDDPPPGTGDRWQKGADLCQGHGIKTSRMSVYRFYLAHILPWRWEQLPAPPPKPPNPRQIARLHDQARHLAARRTLEILHHPRLSPGHLIGLLQNDNHRQQIQLARDQFNDRVSVRRHLERRELFQRMDDRARDKVLAPAQMESFRKLFATLLAIPPHTTP